MLRRGVGVLNLSLSTTFINLELLKVSDVTVVFFAAIKIWILKKYGNMKLFVTDNPDSQHIYKSILFQEYQFLESNPHFSLGGFQLEIQQ